MSENTVIIFVALVAAVILHEISHGVVALLLGDDTAKRAGRLTLNPVPHIDPFGSLILPAMAAIAGFPAIGWAKPVPVNPARLRRTRRDLVFVSLAGPATNMSLALVAALVARVGYDRLDTFVGRFDDLPLGIRIAFVFALVNLLLGLFNLLPIPPLDGSALLERALPAHALPAWYRFRQYGMLILFVLVFTTGFTSRLFGPVSERLFDFVFR